MKQEEADKWPNRIITLRQKHATEDFNVFQLQWVENFSSDVQKTPLGKEEDLKYLKKTRVNS